MVPSKTALWLQVLCAGAALCALVDAAPADPVSPKAGCSFTVKGGALLPSPEPLLLKASGSLDVQGYVEPDSTGVVNLAVGEQIRLVCPGYVLASPNQEEVLATCVSDTSFTVGSVKYDIKSLNCSRNVYHYAAYTGATCANGLGRIILIGHSTSRGTVALMETCFNSNNLEALYSTSTVVHNIGGAETGVDRPSFTAGGFYTGVDPNAAYVRDGQISAFAKLLGSQDLAELYISRTSDYYLARGHLVAKADYVWAQPQRATFFYVNAAPQWQTFNGGNWEKLESSVRKLADTRDLNLLVITGTYGVATLPDVNGKDVPLSILEDGRMPVPSLYWKVVYDSDSKAGVALVGLNNPYKTLAENPDLVLCTSVCSSITWLSWDVTNLKQGEGYCCEVDALRKAISYIPALTVTKLLT